MVFVESKTSRRKVDISTTPLTSLPISSLKVLCTDKLLQRDLDFAFMSVENQEQVLYGKVCRGAKHAALEVPVYRVPFEADRKNQVFEVV